MPKRAPQHRPAHWKSYEEKREESDAKRLSAHQRGYTPKWKRARDNFIRHNPLCVECLKTGIINAAQEIDHIIPHKGDDALFWDSDNWQSLCKSHHSKKTMTEGSFGHE